MTLSQATIDELRSLLGRLAQGLLTPAELQQLNALLAADQQAQQMFADYAMLDACLELLEPQGDNLLAESHTAGTSVSPFFDLSDQSPSFAPSSFLGGTVHATVGYFSSGWPLAYLVATLIFGIGIAIGALVPVSQPVQVAKESIPTKSDIMSKDEFVGRITGMVDCRWEKRLGAENLQSPILNPQSLVALGDNFTLASGLMEITYDTGAKVILQGPVTYEVESKDSGFLSLGKLTARMQKKSEGSNPQSLIPNPSLFSVRTSTAVVTDLGTEFGVEATKEGRTTAHVFRGSVKLQVAAGNENAEAAACVLHENESAQVEGRSSGQAGGERVVVLARSAKPAEFVRELPRRTIRVLDLVDLVAGGDGSTGRRNRGIDPTNGRVTDTPPKTPKNASQYLAGDGKYHRVETLAVVDGVFIPDGRAGPVQTDSAGHRFAGFPATANITPDYVWAGGAVPSDEPGVNPALLEGVNYASPGHAWFYLHANKGITFDLDAIRRAKPGCRLLRFRATAGNTEPVSREGILASADLWVLVDGEVAFRRREINGCNGGFPVTVPIGEGQRFLTLAATDAGNGIGYNWIIFGDPRLELAPAQTQKGSP